MNEKNTSANVGGQNNTARTTLALAHTTKNTRKSMTSSLHVQAANGRKKHHKRITDRPDSNWSLND